MTLNYLKIGTTVINMSRVIRINLIDPPTSIQEQPVVRFFFDGMSDKEHEIYLEDEEAIAVDNFFNGRHPERIYVIRPGMVELLIPPAHTGDSGNT